MAHTQEYYNKLNEAEEHRLRLQELKRPKSCDEFCRFAQYCHKKELQTVDNDPDKCSEYIKLEDYAWDAECGHEQEEYYYQDDYDDYSDFGGEAE